MHALWIVVDALKLPLVLLGLLAPFIGLGVALADDRRTKPWQLSRGAGLRAGIGFALGAVATPILLFLGMCATPPGEGIAARTGRTRGTAIVAALDAFRATAGNYPDSLTRLVPRFLTAADLRGPGGSGYPFEYRRDSTGFVLRFKYVGPGMNECELLSQRRSWSCGGYY